MRKFVALAAAGFLFILGASFPITAQSSKTPLKVIILESRIDQQSFGTKGTTTSVAMLQIKANIQGQTYWLEDAGKDFLERGSAKNGLLKPGEYSAILLDDSSKVPYKINQKYQLLYPDGAHENFSVVGIVGK